MDFFSAGFFGAGHFDADYFGVDAAGPTIINVRDASGVLATTPRATATLSKIGGVMNELYRGESTTLTVTVKVDGVAVAINAGANAVSEIEYTLRSGQLETEGVPAITKTLSGGGIALATQSGATLGQASIDLNTADTNALTPGLYFEQVMVVFADDPGEYVFVVPPQRRIVFGAVRVP